MAATLSPSFAIDGIDAASSESPQVIETPNDRTHAAEPGKDRMAEVSPMRVINLDDIGFTKPWVSKQEERRGIKHVVKTQMIESPSDGLVRQTNQPGRDARNVWVHGVFVSHEHSGLHSRALQAGVHSMGRPGGPSALIYGVDVQDA